MSQTKMTKSVLAVVALLALGLGVWLSLQQLEQREQEQALQTAKQAALKNSSPAVLSTSPVTDVAFLLTMELPDTQGISAPVSTQLAKLTLVNFWATWCAPCREEMPVFNAVHQKYQAQGFGVLGLTIDNPQSTQAFVQQLDIRYPILMAEHEGWDLLSKTGNPKNLMPYSFLIDQQGQVLETKLGPLHEEELESWIEKYL